MQINRCGKILKRTRFDPNEIIIDNNHCRMKLYNRKGEEIAETIFDLEDYNKVKNIKWHRINTGYVMSNKEIGPVSFTKFILNLHKEKETTVDHKNRNKLDNRKENLRICTQMENIKNRGISKNNTSGFKGVSFCKDIKKWGAFIMCDYIPIFIGTFSTKEEAALAYNEKAKELHGEFAVLNEVTI
jgi:hypothetical protein